MFPRSPRRGGGCLSRRISVMAVVRRRGGTLACPSSADHDVRRARRLGAPPLRVSPCGASFFPSDGKETKGSPGETHIAVGNRSPPAPVRSPPVPGEYGDPMLDTRASLSGAGGVMTAPASAPLPLSVRNQDGLVCWTKQARLIAQVLISAGRNRRAGPRLARPRFVETAPSGAPPIPHPLPRLVGTRRGCEME